MHHLHLRQEIVDPSLIKPTMQEKRPTGTDIQWYPKESVQPDCPRVSTIVRKFHAHIFTTPLLKMSRQPKIANYDDVEKNKMEVIDYQC
jgi:hypothetical protein